MTNYVLICYISGVPHYSGVYSSLEEAEKAIPDAYSYYITKEPPRCERVYIDTSGGVIYFCIVPVPYIR